MSYPIRNVWLIQNEASFELWIEINESTWLMEMGKEIGEEGSSSYKRFDKWVRKQYPYLKISTVKLLVGSLVVGTLSLPIHDVTRVHAATSKGAVQTQKIQVILNGKPLAMDQDPVNIGGRVLVPVRALSEALGAEVHWNGARKEVTISRGDSKILLRIGTATAQVNGRQVSLDAQTQIINERTYVPVRFVSEALGTKVNWDSQTKTVFIEQKTILYKVKSGDSLWKIAQAYHVSVEDLKKWNQLSGDEIWVGLNLRIFPAVKATPGEQTLQTVKEVHGYTVVNYAGDTSSLSSLRQNVERLSSVATFTHLVEEDGNLSTYGVPESTIEYANATGVPIYMLVHNLTEGGFSKELLHKVLGNKEKRDTLIKNIVKEVHRYGYNGVEIDFEGIALEDRDHFTQFLKELNQQLDAHGLMLMTAIPAKTWDDPNNAWSGGYDYKEIGKIVDRVMIMSYDEHWSGGPPGPIASYPWFEQVVQYTVETIPKDKIIMGLAAYAYDWPLNGGTAKALSANGLENLIKKNGGAAEWDHTSRTPVYRYQDAEGTYHEVWFEDQRSLQEKIALVSQKGVAGIGIWRLGLENEAFWNTFYTSK